MKVAEFQRRGLVHLHVIARADGPSGPATFPPEWLGADTLEGAVAAAAHRARVARLGGDDPVVWGKELDVVALGTGAHPGDVSAAARYLAKYAVKGSESSGALARRLTSLAQLRRLGLPPHTERLVETAWRLGGRRELRSLRLRDHAHTFGYRGHFATKSQRYSTTFGALRAARAAYRRPEEEAETDFLYAGRGYRTPATARLAEVLAEAARTLPRGSPGGSPRTSPPVPQPPHQGELS